MSMYSDFKRQKTSTRYSRGLKKDTPGEDRVADFIERSRDFALEPVEDGGSIEFQVSDLSPYVLPLDGKIYDVDPPSGPRGTCPLCNNSEARDLDAWYIKTFNERGKWAKRGFPEDLVLDHLVNHIGMVYADVLDGMEEFRKSGEAGRELDLQELVGKVSSALSKKADLVSRHAALDRDADTQVVFTGLPLAGIDIDPSPAIVGRPAGAKAKKWYAWDGSECVGQMRPWEDDRVKTEIAARASDAIVFYDEMLDVRHRARRVYDEIMDHEPDEGMAKNYSAAVAAVREIKGVAMDMAKLALIATKYGDDADKARQISPSMKAMLDDIGIFEPENAMKTVEMDKSDE